MTNNFETTEVLVKRAEIQNEGPIVTVTNKASGGSIGTAPVTVDVAGVIEVNQTTASQILTMASPTVTTIDHRNTVINVGSASFVMYGKTIEPNGSQDFLWNSSYGTPAWVAFGSTGTSSSVAGAITSTSATAGIGYAAGAGGAVTQATSRTTTVVLDKVAGAITLFSAAGSSTPFSFTVTNSTVAATDTIIAVQKSGTDAYAISVTAVAAGSFKLTVTDLTGTTTETPVINFAVLKSVAA